MTRTDRQIALIVLLGFRQPDLEVQCVVWSVWNETDDAAKRSSVVVCHVLSGYRRDVGESTNVDPTRAGDILRLALQRSATVVVCNSGQSCHKRRRKRENRAYNVQHDGGLGLEQVAKVCCANVRTIHTLWRSVRGPFKKRGGRHPRKTPRIVNRPRCSRTSCWWVSRGCCSALLTRGKKVSVIVAAACVRLGGLTDVGRSHRRRATDTDTESRFCRMLWSTATPTSMP
jgi:hypothetical protein